MSANPGLLESLDPVLFQAARELSLSIESEGGNLLMVGGSVRDLLLGFSPDELDFEVHGLSLDQVKSVLGKKYRGMKSVKPLAFCASKVCVEIALPRTEIKSGSGHKGFSVEMDPNLPFEKAVQRRDFTINAMGLDPVRGRLLDPCGGSKDLEQRILRHVSPAFKEDSLHFERDAILLPVLI